MNNKKILKVLEAVKYTLQNYNSIIFDDLCHHQLSEDIMLRKSPVNGHLILTECINGYMEFDLARIKPGIPRSVKIISIDNECYYYRTKTEIKETEEIKLYNTNDINFVESLIFFNVPLSSCDYFNQSLIYDLKISYEVLEAIVETAKYLYGNFNVLHLTGMK